MLISPRRTHSQRAGIMDAHTVLDVVFFVCFLGGGVAAHSDSSD